MRPMKEKKAPPMMRRPPAKRPLRKKVRTGPAGLGCGASGSGEGNVIQSLFLSVNRQEYRNVHNTACMATRKAQTHIRNRVSSTACHYTVNGRSHATYPNTNGS